MNHIDFIHRHDKFKPTFENILLLGFTAGVATTVIVIGLCTWLTK